jgi:sec-independent protein translocase protein TatC
MNDGSMDFWAHFGQLRQSILRSVASVLLGFIGCYAFRKDIFALLRAPYDQAYETVLQKTPVLIQTGLMEAFLVYLKLSLLAGLFIACPFVFYQLWRFIAPGLKKSERKHVVPFVVLATAFFLGGALFGYFMVFPKGFAFFLSITQGENIEPLIKMQDYYKLASWMLLGFGLSFEAPLVALYLVKFGIITADQLQRSWRGVIIGILIFAAIITPTPDPGTLLMMAAPLMVLYGLTIVVAHMMPKGKSRA